MGVSAYSVMYTEYTIDQAGFYGNSLILYVLYA